jgi:hypothetical protein
MAIAAPSEISTVLLDLTRAEQEAAEVVSGLSAGQSNWRPDG